MMKTGKTTETSLEGKSNEDHVVYLVSPIPVILIVTLVVTIAVRNLYESHISKNIVHKVNSFILEWKAYRAVPITMTKSSR